MTRFAGYCKRDNLPLSYFDADSKAINGKFHVEMCPDDEGS